MKIALLTPTFSKFSGIDRVVELDSEEYANKGHKVSIFTLEANIKPKKAKLIVMGMPKNSILQRIYRLFFFLDFIKIRKYSKMLKKYDHAIAYFYPLTWLAYKAKKDFNIKYTYWNAGVAYPKLFKKITEKIYLKLFLRYVKKSVSNADNAISISKFMQKELKRETGLESTVKYIKIDKKRFHMGINGQEIKKLHGIKKDEKVFLYVGRISPHKGIHLLISAFKKAQKKIGKSKLIIAGKPTFNKYSIKLKKMANKDVIFTGFIKDAQLPKYYAACDIYTTASRWEGYDMPVVEAQACGKKVVAFDCCSHPEVVKNGILVKDGNVKKFANAVVKLSK
jgi:glycosyltransferase involved in cell wall biosynthesis